MKAVVFTKQGTPAVLQLKEVFAKMVEFWEV
jgi:hypothetical protein